MAPKKSEKARGKARARRTPSPSPPLSLRLATRRGRRAGAVTYSSSELRLLLRLVRKHRPRTASDWAAIEAEYNTLVPTSRERRATNLRTRFDKLVRMPKPTGNPEANELHEQAVEIDQDLEGMEYTRVLDDSSPAPSDQETIQLSSDSEPEILDPPALPPSTTASGKRKAPSSPTFRAVARKIHPNSQPVQARNPLDTATAHLASILSPVTEQESINRQREDDIGRLTILSLNDTIRDLQAELSQERQRSHTLENQLRNQEMQRQIEIQVREQIRQLAFTRESGVIPCCNPTPRQEVPRLSPGDTLHASFWPDSPPRRTSGEAHPSWKPGPPPERSDASGSGTRHY
ncbi:hypothetical protein RhiJN_15769 [Ceratobasidium sp. AG-Ba]|nr:hypothetical protein RhiJN_15769 [Ceratobasidium sp. AG-Ba]